MSELTTIKTGAITEYKPERHRLTVAAIDYGIEEAKRIKDWPILEEAVDVKIEEQKKFIAWWDNNVGGSGGYQTPGTRRLTEEQAEGLTGVKHQRVSDLRTDLKKPDKYRAKLLGKGYLTAHLDDAHVRGTLGTSENEWYTPAKYIEMARKVLGDIDLDPASSEIAQEVVRAGKWFSAEQNGLKQKWFGRVWLNPPYAQPLIGQFVSKLCEERCSDAVSAAILLTHNYTDGAWFHEGAQIADAVCFTRGRIKFVDPEGNECSPTQGQAFSYFGEHAALFADVFKDIGIVYIPVPGE